MMNESEKERIEKIPKVIRDTFDRRNEELYDSIADGSLSLDAFIELMYHGMILNHDTGYDKGYNEGLWAASPGSGYEVGYYDAQLDLLSKNRDN